MCYRRTVLRIAGFVTGALLFLFSVPAGGTPPPRLLNFSGVLNGTDGKPVTDGVYSTVFSVYDALTGGALLWTETQNVTTDKGRFNVLLGSMNELPANLFSQNERYLGVAVAPDPEMTPRTQLVSVGNAFHSLKSDSSGHSAKADSTKHSAKADSAGHSSKADKADSSKHAARARRSDTADVALSVIDNSIGSINIINGSILFEDVGPNDAAAGQVMKWNGTAWVAANDENAGGGGDISGVTAGSGLTGGGTTGDINLDVGAGPGIAVAADAISLADGGVTESKIADDAVTGTKIADATIALGNLGQNGALPGQVMKWSGAGWVVADDEGVTGDYLPLSGGTMTGPITCDPSSPPISMGKGNFGGGNTNDGMEAFVAGSFNDADGPFSTIGGGKENAISQGADHSAIGGGQRNTANGRFSTVSGGWMNQASGDSSAVGGGSSNRASGFASTVPGGASNMASGSYSFAAGRNARAMHSGTFVWGDDAKGPSPFSSTASNQFLIRASEGVGIGTNHPNSTLDVNGTVMMTGMNMATGAINGYVLTTDAMGTGTWKPPAGSGGPKVYRALLSQSGTNNPTAIVLENTIGAIVWTRVAASEYVGTLTGAFTADKVFLLAGVARSNDGSRAVAMLWRVDNNTVEISAPWDDYLVKTSIEIMVYP